jgi:uncharacterized protein YegP (UPF0339 family)
LQPEGARRLANPAGGSWIGEHEMLARRLLLAAVFLAPIACQGAGTEDGQDCNGGKCDSLDDTGSTDLMPRAPQAPGTISITRNGDQWLCEVIGSYGEIVLLSQAYSERTSALSGALSIEENGVLPERYLVSQSDAGWSFALRAGNNVTLADSRVFETEAEAVAAAELARDLVAGIVQYKAAVTDGARFELSRDGSSWRFDLLGDDGETVMSSQLYSRRHDAITGVESVRANGKDQARYQVLDSPPRFILKAGNGEEIAESAATFADLDSVNAAIAQTQTLLVSERVASPW